MDIESVSDCKEIISKPTETVESNKEDKPCFGLVEIISKEKVVKKIDVQFQLDQFKKIVNFGTETYYKSAPRRSINRWFITETNFRLYVEESKIKSIKNLSDALGTLDKDEEQKEKIISRMSDILIENKPYSPVGVIPYLLSRMYTLPNLRPVILKTFLTVVTNTADLLIFAYYLRKGSGNQTCIRKQLCEWYKIHSSNREYIKDLLLVKRRLGWKHRDVLVHWKIPVDVNDGILRILMDFPFDATKIPQDKVSLIEKILKLRNIDDRTYWIGLVTSPEYIDEIGLDLCYNLKTLIINAEVLQIIIQRIPFNDLIEYIPRMYQKLPFSKDLMTAIVNQLSDWKKKYTIAKSDVNILSVFAVWKWLTFQQLIYHGPGKSSKNDDGSAKKYYPLPTLDIEKAILSVLEDDLFKRSDEVLFVLNASQSDLEESGITISRKPSTQELRRPSLYPNIIKAGEFVQFLLFIYPNHRVVYNNKFYKISGKSFKMLEEEFSKMRQNISQEQSDQQKTFKNAIHVSFDGSVDLSEDGTLSKHKVEKIAFLSVSQKEIIQTKEKSKLRNMLVIKGIDCNFLPFIERYFHGI